MKHEIIDLIQQCGIRDIGFCAYDRVAARLLPCRNAKRLPAAAATVIICTFPYKVTAQRPKNISRYAAVPDYHRVCGDFLNRAAACLRERFPHHRFEVFIDNSPIPEVYAAACAGLGVYGENGLLITPEYGSWVFLGEIVTDLIIPCENRFKRCSLCGVCKKACPRGDQGEVCLSAVSQQKKDLSAAEQEALRRHSLLWGCDLCAESCPMNRNAATTYIAEFITGYRDGYTPGENITDRAYAWRGEAVIARNWKNMQKSP